MEEYAYKTLTEKTTAALAVSETKTSIDEGQPLLRHMHFRDSNSLTPGYGTVDFKAVMRALKRTGYEGYSTIETSPMVPDPDTAARDGIEYLKFAERIAEYQLSDAFPNGYSLRG
jgi:hypothetical protein